VHVTSLGLSVLKGSAQDHPASLPFAAHGPVGDRSFCCVDPAAARVLRTVENPSLLRLRARQIGEGSSRGEELVVEVPGEGTLRAPVRVAGELSADYWGRTARLDVLDGPWAAALSRFLGREVVLARARPRDVVYGGGVTVVTTSSLRETARRAGVADVPADDAALVADAERWRASVVVDTGDAEPFVEDGWVGRRLQVGAVELRVTGRVARCAVVRLRPREGTRDSWDPLALLARDRIPADAPRPEVVFGVEAEVVRAGTVHVGDTVQVEDPVQLSDPAQVRDPATAG
jgi:uncharacterized protein YcbX